MFRAWSKIVVASLFLLVVDAFASEGNQRVNDSYEASSVDVQQSLTDAPDDYGYRWQTLLADIAMVQSGFNHTCLAFAVVSTPVSELRKYCPFSPRAPPAPAS